MKQGKSVDEKIDKKLEQTPGRNILDIVNEMNDLVRYTQICDDPDQIPGVAEKSIAKLLKQGFKLKEIDNKYTDPNSTAYRGLHLVLRHPCGQLFELQIHTKYSFDVKESTHNMYEEARNVDCPPERRAELMEKMHELSATVPIPEGIARIKSIKYDV